MRTFYFLTLVLISPNSSWSELPSDAEKATDRWSYQGTTFQYLIELADDEVKISKRKSDQNTAPHRASKLTPELELPGRGKLPAKLSITHVTACKWKEQGIIAVFNFRHEARSGSFWFSDSGQSESRHFGLIVHPDPVKYYRCLDVRPVGNSDLVEFIFNEYESESQTRPERMLFYYNPCVSVTQAIGDPGTWHLLTLGKEIDIPNPRRFPKESDDE